MIVTELIHKDALQAYESAFEQVGGSFGSVKAVGLDQLSIDYVLQDYAMMEKFIYALSTIKRKPEPAPYWQSWFKKAAQ